MYTNSTAVSGFLFIFAIQVILLIVFGFITRYDDLLLPEVHKENGANGGGSTEHGEEGTPVRSYAHFQDIHAMIFVGFGFLMTFLKKYGYSASGFNLLVAALLIQWAIIARGLFHLVDGYIHISLDNMIGADIAVASVLISMGALLGRTTPIQLLLMGIIEIAVFAANEYLQVDLMKVADVGGSITVHAFGAYFGLAVSFMLRPNKDEIVNTSNEGASKTSDLFAMIGTLFLWIYWPSFNSVLADGPEQQRAILNTYLSLGAATVTAFIVSAIVSHDNKFDMVHVQNSTLAGGVAVGSVCNLLIHPHGAIMIGMFAGILSVLGYRYLSPLMTSKIRLMDTCGVHNLHGMPAVLSACFSAIYAALATEKNYKQTLIQIFPAMEKISDSLHNNLTVSNENITEITKEYVIGGYGRCAECQGGYQLLAIFTTIVIAILSGLLTGLFLKTPNIKRLPQEMAHDDSEYWEVPDN